MNAHVTRRAQGHPFTSWTLVAAALAIAGGLLPASNAQATPLTILDYGGAFFSLASLDTDVSHSYVTLLPGDPCFLSSACLLGFDAVAVGPSSPW